VAALAAEEKKEKRERERKKKIISGYILLSCDFEMCSGRILKRDLIYSWNIYCSCIINLKPWLSKAFNI